GRVAERTRKTELGIAEGLSQGLADEVVIHPGTDSDRGFARTAEQELRDSAVCLRRIRDADAGRPVRVRRIDGSAAGSSGWNKRDRSDTVLRKPLVGQVHALGKPVGDRDVRRRLLAVGLINGGCNRQSKTRCYSQG